MESYELIEHTADIGIRVKGASLEDIFRNAAAAMFDIIAGEKPKTPQQRPQPRNIAVGQKADNLEDLFLNWLNELLSLSATKELIFSDFLIDKLDENNLKATAIGAGIENYKVNTEIKAATYHRLKIEKVPGGWQAEVIFDV
ncbi:MAG: archease [Candidatus Omnitrophota bacterium]